MFLLAAMCLGREALLGLGVLSEPNIESRALDRQSMRARLLIPVLFCALISQAGCIVLPIPAREHVVLAGKPVTEDQLDFITPKVTTKSEVVARLGSPNVIWEEARLFSYDWEMRQGILIWAIGAHYSGAAGISDIPSHHMLLVRFDDQDRVQHFERAVRPPFKSYGDFLKEWIADSDAQSSERSNQTQD
jgi:hypothetical protein